MTASGLVWELTETTYAESSTSWHLVGLSAYSLLLLLFLVLLLLVPHGLAVCHRGLCSLVTLVDSFLKDSFQFG